jgi:hypothetical protein
MLKIGDQVAINNCLVNYSNVTQVGRFRGKIVQISDHSVEPLYQIKYDSSKSPWHYGWRYEKDLLHIVVICA